MSRRHPLRPLLAVYLLLVAAGLTAYVVTRLLPLVLLGAAGIAGWRVARRRRSAHLVSKDRPRPVLRIADDRDRQAAELADTRRQVEKLEQDAADHDELLERLERVTRRPVELHIADLERAQGLYGPAAFGGKTGRQP
jgi:hypothetical protein